MTILIIKTNIIVIYTILIQKTVTPSMVKKLCREKQVTTTISKSIHPLCDFTQWEQYNLNSLIESITKMLKMMFWTFHSAYGSNVLVKQD